MKRHRRIYTYIDRKLVNLAQLSIVFDLHLLSVEVLNNVLLLFKP
jgi:hypothetical protein